MNEPTSGSSAPASLFDQLSAAAKEVEDEAGESAAGTHADETTPTSVDSLESGATDETPDSSAEGNSEDTGNDSDSGEGSTEDTESSEVSDQALSQIPEKYRALVKQHVDGLVKSRATEIEKGFKSAFTKKTQELAAQKNALAPVLNVLEQHQIPPDKLESVIQEFAQIAQLLKTPGVRVVRNNEVLLDNSPQEPDYDTMTKAELAQYMRNQLKAEREQLEREFADKLKTVQEPLAKQQETAAYQSKVQTLANKVQAFKSSTKIDDVTWMKAAELARSYEAKTGVKFGEAFFEDLGTSMKPFIDQAKAEIARAKQVGKNKVARPSNLESVNSETRQIKKTYSGKLHDMLRQAAEDTAEEVGFE